MFFSLNKKLIYTITVFFLFTSLIFIYAFYILNANKIREEQKSAIARNQQYIELLYQNISLRKELSDIKKEHPVITLKPEIGNLVQPQDLNEKQKQISLERKRADETLKNYDDRYQALAESFKIVLISAVLFFFALLALWILIRIWVLKPIDKLSKVSRLVLDGNYASRLQLPPDQFFSDEFDNLMHTFNSMLDNIENGIREIRKTESFLQSLIDSIPDGIRVLDEQGNIIIANKEYYRQINSNENCIGRKCYESSQNRKEQCPYSLFTCPLRALREKKASSIKFIQQFAAYPNRHLAINAAPLNIQDAQGKTLNYIVESIRDLSEDIRFSHQQKLSSLGFLATSVAHEMKNHLGSIRMITEGLLNKYFQNRSDEDEEKKYLTLIDKQLVECINVPERLLKMAQFSQEEQSKFSLQSGIHDVISLLDYEAKRNGISISFQTPPKEASLLGNEADFKMMIMNLMQNALKAMPDGGSLAVRLSVGKQIKIEIEDTGQGIPADKLKRIFEPFYSQGHSSQHQGTGLGLAIVKSIVEKLNGTIEVKSKPGLGTCFTIKFPLK